MKRRVFFSILWLTVVSLLVAIVAICFVFYNQLSSSVQSEVRERAYILGSAVTPGEYTGLSISDMRLTIIAADGAVLFDDDEKASALQNHADREEVWEALSAGAGESKRFSDTLGQETYYYALRLADGSVLRVAKTMSSILGMFGGALPVVAAVLAGVIIIGYFLSSRLTRRILRPINEVDLSSELSPPYDELAPFVKTINEQRKQISGQMSDLSAHNDTMQAVLENMGEGALLLDRKGAVITVNKSAATFFDLPKEVKGKNFLELFRDISFSGRAREALMGQRSELTMEQAGKIVRAYFSPVSDIGAIILFMDITEKARAEDLRREFSANVSHELKTPLTTIYGNAEMLSGGMVKEADKPIFYGKIKDEAGRVIALIEDILLISQLDEGAESEREDVELSAVAAEAIEGLTAKAGENGVAIEIDAQPTLMKANRAQMFELFYNLVDNAIKYNKPGGTVKVTIAKHAGQIEFSVSDTGIGIPKEAQSRVFERFYRVDKSRSKLTGGTGLGLAIVKHIVLAHGGEITLKSHWGKGTTIAVCVRPMGYGIDSPQ